MSEYTQAGNPQSVTISVDELTKLIDAKVAERVAATEEAHAKALAEAYSLVPRNTIPNYGGGPTVNNIRPSWSLAEQELARSGEDLEHWH